MSELSSCPKCGCTHFDMDVTIDVLDGKPLHGRYLRVYCKNCGVTCVRFPSGRVILTQDFTLKEAGCL